MNIRKSLDYKLLNKACDEARRMVSKMSPAERQELLEHARKIIDGQHPNPQEFDSAWNRTTQ